MYLTNQEQLKNFYGLNSTYYTFDASGFHFVILDGNEKDPDFKQGYPRYIGEKQQEWLKDDLQKTSLPVVVFVHQPLGDDEAGIINRSQIRDIFEEANKRAGFKKVIACINGHTHIDHHQEIKDERLLRHTMGYWLRNGCSDGSLGGGWNTSDRY